MYLTTFKPHILYSLCSAHHTPLPPTPPFLFFHTTYFRPPRPCHRHPDISPNPTRRQPCSYTRKPRAVLRQVHAGDGDGSNQPDQCRQHAGRHLPSGGIILKIGSTQNQPRNTEDIPSAKYIPKTNNKQKTTTANQ